MAERFHLIYDPRENAVWVTFYDDNGPTRRGSFYAPDEIKGASWEDIKAYLDSVHEGGIDYVDTRIPAENFELSDKSMRRAGD